MTKDKIWEASLVVLGGAITGVVGFLTGWLLNKWQREDERMAGIENRKREFLAFMDQLRAQVNGQTEWGAFFIFHLNKVPNFHHAVRFIRKDIPDAKREAFEKLVKAVSTYNRSKVPTENQVDLLKSIDALVAFVESN